MDRVLLEEFASQSGNANNNNHNSIPKTRARSRTSSVSPLSSPGIGIDIESFPVGSPSHANHRSIEDTSGKRRLRSRNHDESKKLLDHILHELDNRPRPPPVFDDFRYDRAVEHGKRFDAIVHNVSSKFRMMPQPRSTPVIDDSDEEDINTRSFSTDVTFALMVQLRDVLLISHAQGWHIFNDRRDISYRGDHAKLPLPHRRSSLVSYEESISLDVVGDSSSTIMPSRLMKCIALLASVVLEDCRFLVSGARLTRPPGALQAITLDVAQFLAALHCDNPITIYEISCAVMPAFFTFPAQMHTRLVSFFQENILRRILRPLGLADLLGPDELRFDQSRGDFAGGEKHFQAVAPVYIQVDATPDGGLLDVHQNNTSTYRRSTGNLALTHQLAYYSATVSELLAVILDKVDLDSSDLILQHRMRSLLEFVVKTKCDAFVDVLELIAYGTDRVRMPSIRLFTTYWPESFGHCVVSKVITPFSLKVHPSTDTKKESSLRETYYTHQFVPWKATSSSSAIKSKFTTCRSCSEPVSDFCLFCPFCMCVVHFRCFDEEGSRASHKYHISEGSTDMERVAVRCFSNVLTTEQIEMEAPLLLEDHAFVETNIFTLSLCFICQKPLWGCTMQGLRCRYCSHTAHRDCAIKLDMVPPICDRSITEPIYFEVAWKVFKASFLEHYQDILLPEREAVTRSYEEISILHCTLWIQHQLVVNGIESGSTVIVDSDTLPIFELQKSIEVYDALLLSNRLSKGAFLGLLNECDSKVSNTLLFFNWEILGQLISSIKMAHSDITNTDNTERVTGLPSNRIEATLKAQLSLVSHKTVSILFSHLHQLGLFKRASLPMNNDYEPSERSGTYCIFPLPFGMDHFSESETLLTVVEVCLKDLDLSANEIGLLLLVRALWPSTLPGSCLRRVAFAVLTWILNEDNCLAIIINDYTSKGRTLPGVPSASENSYWPNFSRSRMGSANNGGEYVSCRRTLLSLYARPWLMALYENQRLLYTKALCDACLLSAKMGDYTDNVFNTASQKRYQYQTAENNTNVAEKLLRLVSKLFQLSLVFSDTEYLISFTLDFLLQVEDNGHPPSINRFFLLDSDSNTRKVYNNSELINNDSVSSAAKPDMWEILLRNAASQRENLKMAIALFRLFASSGEDITTKNVFALYNIAKSLGVGFGDDFEFLEAIFITVWMRSIGKQNFQSIIASLLSKHYSQTIEALQVSGEKNEIAFKFIRLCLASCLLLFGCERGVLIDIGLIDKSDVASLSSRRRSTRRASTVEDPIIVDSKLIESLSAYIETKLHCVHFLIAQFLSSFINDATLVESYEVDNFILRNSLFVTKCVWRFYSYDDPRLSPLRCTLLPRILLVDAQPFELMMSDLLHQDRTWEKRIRVAERLFRIILDMKHPLFVAEGRQWKPCFIPVFYYFFSRIWMDGQEEIRVMTEIWCQSLQPTHFLAIASYWDEYMTKAPISERVKLVSFLLQLRSHFPNWKVLSWDVIVETLLDDYFMQKNGDDETMPASAHLSMYGISFEISRSSFSALDPHMADLQSSLLLLALKMIGDGISAELFTTLKLKFHLATFLGFKDAKFVPAPNGQSFHVRYGELGQLNKSAYPCVEALLHVLDASSYLDIPSSAMVGYQIDDTRNTRSLVGTLFVDVIIDTINQVEILTIPSLTLKEILRAVTIVIYKYDLETSQLKHLKDRLRKVVKKVTDLYSLEINLELQSLSITICQAYLDIWPSQASYILTYQVQKFLSFLSSIPDGGDNLLVSRTYSFLDITLSRYSSSGLVYQLFKRPLEKNIFDVLGRVFSSGSSKNHLSADLKETVLRDTFLQILNQPQSVDNNLKQVLHNMQTFIENVYHEGYSSELIQFVGRSLVAITRTASERMSDDFDPNTVLYMMSSLAQYNKLHSREILEYIEVSLRIAVTKFSIDLTSLARLLQSTSILYRRQVEREVYSFKNVGSSTAASIMIEVCSDALRCKVRILPYTLYNIIECLMYNASYDNESDSPLYATEEDLFRLATDSVFCLRQNASFDNIKQLPLNVQLIISKLLFRAANRDVEFLSRQFIEPSIEKQLKIRFSLKAWNVLALCALRASTITCATTLMHHFYDFTFDYQQALQMHRQTLASLQDLQVSEVNHAYVAFKVWLLLARKIFQLSSEHEDSETLAIVFSTTNEDEEIKTNLIWNELWPPFERLLQNGESYSDQALPIAISVWTTAADIFLFLRQMRSISALEFSSQISILNKIIPRSRNDSITGKLSRAMNSMSEPPPDLNFKALVDQVEEDIIAAEKLRSIEAMNEIGRNIPEKSRRDVRIGA